jgi:hypothetical protein
MASDGDSSRRTEGRDEDVDGARLDRLLREAAAVRDAVLAESQTKVVGEDAVVARFRARMAARPRRRHIPRRWLFVATAAALVFGIVVERSFRSRAESGDGGDRRDGYLGAAPFRLRDLGRFGTVQLSAAAPVTEDVRLELVVRALDEHDQPGRELWRAADVGLGPIEVPAAMLTGVERIEFQLTAQRVRTALPDYVTHRQSR